MNTARHRILPPGSVLGVLDPLVTLDQNKFDLLKTEIGGPNGFIFDKTRSTALAEKLELSSAHIEALISVLDGLYSRTKDILSGESEIKEALNEFIDRLRVEDAKHLATDAQMESLKSRLVDLIASNYQSIEKSKNIERLKDGFLKNAIGVGSFVDLRPNFNEDYSEIENWIGIVQFRITTDSNIALDRELVFQCDQESLAELRKAIDKAETKLNSMIKSAESKGIVVIKESGISG